jgi:peptidoglycan DL-endopeptidase CwlO
MASPLVTTLSAPIRRVQALVGPGWAPDSAAEPSAVLRGVHETLTDVAAAAGQAWRQAEASWSGTGGDAAARFAVTTSAAIDQAAERAGELGTAARGAADTVAWAHRRLQDIVDEFEATAATLEPRLDDPGVARHLLTAARDALARAIAVVEELLADLDRRAAALDTRAAPPAAPAAPAAPTAPASWSGGSGGGWGGGSGGGWSGSSGAEPAMFTAAEAPADTPDAAMFGDGVAVRLPDGAIVMAPNAVAADAVRHALTQLGVPYQWGGTAPGRGLDCSGLTQWAYREAGFPLPRLAQEQDIGAAVAPGALLPGDLAVWDGHVAMIVGDGLMIEAGDPVKLSPIRTSNAGQGFQGFWRPTG